MLPTILSRRSLLALGAIALPVVGWAVFRLMRPSRVTSRIVVADSPTAASTLFYVAKEEGYFADEGIEIETVSANSGKEALDLIINGKAELCMAAEAPIVGAIMNGEEVQILATIQSNERNTAIIVPDQSSIVAPGDLRGHRVGYFPGTASQYFLTVFLNANSLSGADISAIVLSPKDAHEALARGDVDALSAWQEVRARADKLLGRRTRVMYADGCIP